MKITTKLASNTVFLLTVNAAIVVSGLTGISRIRARVGDLTERSTPYQTRALDCQRSIQGAVAALSKASFSKTLPELEGGKANTIQAINDVRVAEESLAALFTAGSTTTSSAELSKRAEETFPILETNLKAELATVEAGVQVSARLAESSRQLKDLDTKIRALQLNRMALFMSKLEQSEKIEEVRGSPAITQSSIATNCLLGNSELVWLGTMIDARSQHLLNARSANELAAAAQGTREAFEKIDPAIVYLEKMLKKLDAQEELTILASVKNSIYVVRPLLLSDSGAFGKITRSIQMTEKVAQVNQSLAQFLAQHAEDSRTRVSNAHSDEEKTVRSVNDLVHRTTRGILVLGISATLIGLVFSLALALSIARPIKEFGTLTEKFGQGDLTVHMNQDRRDEFGGMAIHFNGAAEKIGAMVGQLASASGSLAQGAAELSATASSVYEEAGSISAQIEQNAANAMQTNDRMKSARTMVTTANESMLELTAAIKVMVEQSEAAQNIIKTINDIAFKTNILSLNAAVEAARAGSAGAGFEIVAREVRNLSAQTAQAAQSTTELIGEIVARSHRGREVAETTKVAFSKVTSLTAEVDGFIGAIAASAHDQELRIKKINSQTTSMGQISNENAAAAQQLSSSIACFRVISQAVR